MIYRNDEGGLDLGDRGIIDVAGLVDVLQEDDSLDQQNVYDAVCNNPDDDPTLKLYDEIPEVRISLDRLKSMYEMNQADMAMRLLHKRVNLEIDPHKKIRLDDPNYAYTCNKSYLDFIMIVGNEMGLDAFLPKSPSTTGFALTLCVTLPTKEFRVKHGNLGFDPTGCIMYVGKMSVEDLWIGMAPASFFEDVTSRFDLNQRHGDTRMALRRFRQLMAYILKVLTALPDMDIFVADPYQVNLAEGPHGLLTNAL
jgi:hypothetical protein